MRNYPHKDIAPIFWFPTKILFCDDQNIFLNSIENSLKKRSDKMMFCTNIDNYIEEINKQDDLFLTFFINKNLYDSDNIELGSVQYNELQNLQNYDDKTNYYSIIFVDYDMQVRNGLEILKDIENPYVYKVLLTGVADETIAIQAFKDGLIDDYIRKQDFNSLNEIEKTIEKGKLHFFNRHSEFIKKYLKQNMVKNTPINDTTYQSFLLKNMCNNHIEEFYMIESSGSYFLITDKGKKRILHVCSKEDIRSYAETYRDDLEKMNLYENIITGEKIICAYSDNKENLPEKICKDSNFIYDANQILGSNIYYYAFIDV
jgi:CheY-like chemotaxis protein